MEENLGTFSELNHRKTELENRRSPQVIIAGSGGFWILI
jgi:hypothetical protein